MRITNDNEEYCQYYTNYTGPDLVSILVNDIENKELYLKVMELYGTNKDWNHKLYKSRLLFDETFVNKTITFNYKPNYSKTFPDGIPNWTKYKYNNGNEYFNLPLWTPMSINK